MHNIIHRGQHEIGGMCIEVAADDGTRILLDLGMPLCDRDHADYPRDTPQRPTAELVASGVLRDIPGLYAQDPESRRSSAVCALHVDRLARDSAHVLPVVKMWPGALPGVPETPDLLAFA